MRGEHSPFAPCTCQPRGSSPHARGARHRAVCRVRGLGIIPACAGSTCTRSTLQSAAWDHPRMRGEHLDRMFVFPLTEGSSPHARGALNAVGSELRGRGIIPACAGSTHRREAADPPQGDHPRMRGEHETHPVTVAMTLGSSPHARGARIGVAASDGVQGIIPACAGSTSSNSPS